MTKRQNIKNDERGKKLALLNIDDVDKTQYLTGNIRIKNKI